MEGAVLTAQRRAVDGKSTRRGCAESRDSPREPRPQCGARRAAGARAGTWSAVNSVETAGSGSVPVSCPLSPTLGPKCARSQRKARTQHTQATSNNTQRQHTHEKPPTTRRHPNATHLGTNAHGHRASIPRSLSQRAGRGRPSEPGRRRSPEPRCDPHCAGRTQGAESGAARRPDEASR